MIGYTITSGKATPEELLALEDALKRHEKPQVESAISTWAKPQLRKPLPRKA